MGRRRVIFLASLCVLLLLLLLAPAAQLFQRVPELLVPALVAWLMGLAVVFRLVAGHSFASVVMAAAGLRVPGPARATRRRRVARALVTSMWAVWALVAVTAAALWFRSHRVEDHIDRATWDVLGVTPSRWVRRFHRRVSIASESGVLGCESAREIILDPQYVLNKEAPVRLGPWRKVTWTNNVAATALGISFPRRFRTVGSPSKLLDAFGIEYSNVARRPRFPGDPAEGLMILTVPWRVICLAAALPPLLAGGVKLARVRRVRPGHCRNCGYDLRATPGRCPECGEEPAAEQAPGARP